MCPSDTITKFVDALCLSYNMQKSNLKETGTETDKERPVERAHSTTKNNHRLLFYIYVCIYIYIYIYINARSTFCVHLCLHVLKMRITRGKTSPRVRMLVTF